MELKPVGDNAPRQPFTTTLKNICLQYPAGGVVLRELLQNADDAGATVVRFHLDERNHPQDKLINKALAKYQGPALLAYNNAVFTEKDFKSISRPGNSLKLQDGLTTGRYGLGFNSVYNWTDSPTIVSRDHLLILDPHEEWSPGGNIYDFVAAAKYPQIPSHMAAFQSVMDDPTKPFEGTIVRIPLRTQEQAVKSEISSNETTVTEIRTVLENFATEFGDSGLLFLKNLMEIQFSSSDGLSISIAVSDSLNVTNHKSKVNDALRFALKDTAYKFDHSFEMNILRRSGEKSKEIPFVIHHTICGQSMDTQIQEWAKEQKFVSWVAVAAQLPSPENFQGSLFNVLPLPLPINQPVHIHGSFSISPDRASLHELKKGSSQDQRPAKWNEWLFSNPIPIAWTQLLSRLALLHPRKSTFEWWPRNTDGNNDILSKALNKFVDLVAKDSLPLWSTCVGHVKATDGLLNKEGESKLLRDALDEAKVPVVYVPDRLRQSAQHLFNEQALSPQRLCTFLTDKNGHIKGWSLSAKQAILEYILSDPSFAGYGSLELFPFKDGNYRSIAEHTAFVHRSDFELELFHLQHDHNIDFIKISSRTATILKEGCENSALHKSIRQRSEHDLKDYCLKFYFSEFRGDQDTVSLSSQGTVFVSRVWNWIYEQRIDVAGAISDLWLIPVTTGHHRKIKPRLPSSGTIFAPAGSLGDLMRTLDARCSSRTKPLLDTSPSGLSLQAQDTLMAASRKYSNLLIEDGRNVTDFVRWLRNMQTVVNSASEKEKDELIKFVALQLPTPLSTLDGRAIGDAIGDLEIFKKISWKTEDNKASPTLVWTSAKASARSINLHGSIVAVPTIANVQFLHAPYSSNSFKLLDDLKLATYLKTVAIIQQYIILYWDNPQTASLSYSCKVQLSKLVFNHYSALSVTHRTKLRELLIVPVTRLNGKATSRFATAADLIDPSSGLAELFFDEEEVVPASSFLKDFHASLIGIGLKNAVDEALISDRVRCYENSSHPVSEIHQRVLKLLKSPCLWNPPKSGSRDSDLRHMKWLPVPDQEKVLVLRSPKECRSNGDESLIGSQMIIFDIWVSKDWQKRLGWCDVLPKQSLLEQLNHGIRANLPEVVDKVLTYVVDQKQTELFIDELAKLPCIRTSKGLHVTVSKVFQDPEVGRSCERLHPYLGDIDTKFWQKHHFLLSRMKIKKSPSPGDLLDVQRILESKLKLSQEDLKLAVDLLNIAASFPRAELIGLKVLTKELHFCPVEDISYFDLGILTITDKVTLTHPSITLPLAKWLHIEPLSERLMKGLLEIEDIDDEDEFEQHEQITTRIADTLDRYIVTSTFREYLANSDDTIDTSTVNWLLDERNHPKETLLTQELKDLQGPALLVHNDGVFSEKDYKGFKNVGEGSKGSNKGTIGQFGRGSQTMYHWTDVPMILSGKYLLILDPQQQVLPKNQIKGKHKPGVKLALSKLKNACPDQLAPFDGLFGYHRDLDSYPGTIFRFPLRTKATKSMLRTRETDLDAKMVRQHLTAYFDEARISLLFVKRIASITFKVQGTDDCGWSVRKDPTDSEVFSQAVKCSFKIIAGSGAEINGEDKWWVAIQDLQPEADCLPFSPRRVMKNVECGIAGLVSSEYGNVTSVTTPTATRPHLFSTLPLPLSSNLPVCIHASFSLTGDRQSLDVVDRGLDSTGSAWNRWLLATALPELYLSFLEDIARYVRNDALRFWPQEEPPKGSHSELLCSTFWAEVPTSSGRFFPKAQLAPIPNQRQAPILFDIRETIFDFLTKTRSAALAPLLLSLNVKLVQQVPNFIANKLKKAGVQSVTGPMLRGLLKSEKSRMQLQKEISKNPQIIDELLPVLLPVENLGDLNGCNILPLADGTVATLRLLDPAAPDTDYYFATKEEQEIFKFASKLLLSPTADNRFEKVISCKELKFNIEKLKLRHIGRLLEKRQPPASVDALADVWLTKFWNYWNKTSKSSSEAVNYEFPGMFRASFRGVDYYLGLSDLNLRPAVVEPSLEEHQQLCAKFPGLWRFSSGFMPLDLKASESSLFNSASFFRFFDSLRKLAAQDGEILGDFMKKHLTMDDFKIIRKLIKFRASQEVTKTEPISPRFCAILAGLKSIPLFPSNGTTTQELLCAKNALITRTREFLVPWMKEYGRFIDLAIANDSTYKNCIDLLGMQPVSTLSLLSNYVLPLPSMSSARAWAFYEPFISAASALCEVSDNVHDVRKAFADKLVAADGEKYLRKAPELYDHEDPIFKAAFRGQEASKFLHPDVQRFRKFWKKLGMRSPNKGVLDPDDYLSCLKSMSLNVWRGDIESDDALAEDIRTVLGPLISTSLTSSSQRFNWLVISQVRVFPSRSTFNDQPEYRRVPMGVAASDQPLLTLSEIISYDHAAICWSQTSFPLHEPTTTALSFVNGKGKPSAEIVWRHLEHLANMAQDLQQGRVKDFLHDLHCTYWYLQEHPDTRAYFNLHKKALWLNMIPAQGQPACLADVKSSWNEIGDLVLSSSCDAGRIKAVRPSLMRYERLLTAIGCKSIIYPTNTTPVIPLGHSLLASLRKLRDEVKTCDITYCTEGKEIHAHRLVLVAVSEKCAHQWNGSFPIEPRITFDEDLDPECFLSYHTLSTMIDFAYETEINWGKMEASEKDDADAREEKLEVLLDLYKGADYWRIETLASQVEARIVAADRKFINIENVVATRDRAAYINAKAVERICNDFIQGNLDTVNRANKGAQ